QNFLLDLNLTGRIARAAGPVAGYRVIEVGPGPGGLTRALLAVGAEKVIAIEKDTRCIAALRPLAEAYPGRLEVIAGDALTFDLATLGAGPTKIVANLPYNIATPLLIGWLSPAQWPPVWDNLTLMFQKEVAQRIVAQPGSKAYGRLSVITQWRCDAEILFDVPAKAFTPPPKVTSAIVQITPRAAPMAAIAQADLERVTMAAFGQRRKMLRRSLSGLGVSVPDLLTLAGLEPTARAEEIDVAGFCALAKAYAGLRETG
ncbi:MAG TPA: 16S rRNA (adenine(1518)-N(6)/adenine(1519)-N(6))-dimethyltransferase, partial [Alphaproteobacteria bacterium]|nr:16S rRNA (adenine(1518)-N(6)/adenine(1519)-N(6))-dimethyltransferase [Alphaproteobacteria bacterium]